MPKAIVSPTVLRDLHPLGSGAFRGLKDHLEQGYRNEKTRSYFRPFEGLRTPAKQLELQNVRPPVTQAGPWQSAHQHGLAVDFVPWSEAGGWDWSDKHDWKYLKASAQLFGLDVPIDWDKAHVEHPCWPDLRKWLANWKPKAVKAAKPA